jgi:hypothetical protein
VLRAEKVEVCKALTRPVATYGAEFWAVNKDIVKSLWLLLKEKC